MATITEIMKRLEGLDVMQAAADSIDDTREDLIRHQLEQMFAGQNSKGREIKPFYRPSTIARKRKKGQPTDRVTLKDTGSFYGGVFVDVRKDTFVIDSTDPKSAAIAERYKNIFGLAGQFKVDYIRDLSPVFNSKIENVTGLKFGP
jgi:hypothetical protein